jgi:hypothetical protein
MFEVVPQFLKGMTVACPVSSKDSKTIKWLKVRLQFGVGAGHFWGSGSVCEGDQGRRTCHEGSKGRGASLQLSRLPAPLKQQQRLKLRWDKLLKFANTLETSAALWLQLDGYRRLLQLMGHSVPLQARPVHPQHPNLRWETFLNPAAPQKHLNFECYICQNLASTNRTFNPRFGCLHPCLTGSQAHRLLHCTLNRLKADQNDVDLFVSKTHPMQYMIRVLAIQDVQL